MKIRSVRRSLNHAKTHHNYMKKVSLEFVLGVGLGLLLLSTMQVSAQPLSKDALTGNVTEVDINTYYRTASRQRNCNNRNRRCIDKGMNAFPLKGFTSSSSDTVTVTNRTVDIEYTDVEEEGSEFEGQSEEEYEPDGRLKESGPDGRPDVEEEA